MGSNFHTGSSFKASNCQIFMSAPSLFVIVPGFGRPHTLEKVRILESNIQYIRKYPWARLHFRICVYDPEAFLYVPSSLREDPSMEWIVRQGIVGEFLHTCAPPSVTSAFDFVLILLDDIELHSNVDFARILRYHNMFGFDIYSPTLTSGSKYQFEYMLSRPESSASLMVVSACEAFCYFMSSASYAKYYEHINPHANPWLWGMDMCLSKCIGLRPCLLNHMMMTHYYKNECYQLRPDQDPVQGYNYVLERYGVTTQELANQLAVRYSIVDHELFTSQKQH